MKATEQYMDQEALDKLISFKHHAPVVKLLLASIIGDTQICRIAPKIAELFHLTFSIRIIELCVIWDRPLFSS